MDILCRNRSRARNFYIVSFQRNQSSVFQISWVILRVLPQILQEIDKLFRENKIIP